MKLSPFDVIEKPLITEKAANLSADQNQYFFAVHPKATKTQIKQAIEQSFNVKVVAVKTMNVFGKFKRLRYEMGRRPNWKKAIVSLKQGDKIDLAP